MQDQAFEREPSFDVIKGMGIILLILGHIDQGDNFLCNWIYSFHLPLFFIITGILIQKNDELKKYSFTSFAKRKLEKILYPYATFSGMTIVFFLICYGLTGVDFGIRDVLIRTITLEGYSTLWYLPALMMALLLFYLFYPIFLKYRLSILFPMAVTSVISRYIYPKVTGEYVGASSSLFLSLNFLNRATIGAVFISIGYFGWTTLKEKADRVPKGMWPVLVLLEMFLSQTNKWVDLHYSLLNQPVLYYMFAILNSFTVICALRSWIPNNRFFSYWGRNSLIVMCTHTTLKLLWASKVIGEEWLIGILPRYLYDIVLLGIILIAEYAIIGILRKYFYFLIQWPKKARIR